MVFIVMDDFCSLRFSRCSTSSSHVNNCFIFSHVFSSIASSTPCLFLLLISWSCFLALIVIVIKNLGHDRLLVMVLVFIIIAFLSILNSDCLVEIDVVVPNTNSHHLLGIDVVVPNTHCHHSLLGSSWLLAFMSWSWFIALITITFFSIPLSHDYFIGCWLGILKVEFKGGMMHISKLAYMKHEPEVHPKT